MQKLQPSMACQDASHHGLEVLLLNNTGPFLSQDIKQTCHRVSLQRTSALSRQPNSRPWQSEQRMQPPSGSVQLICHRMSPGEDMVMCTSFKCALQSMPTMGRQ